MKKPRLLVSLPAISFDQVEEGLGTSFLDVSPFTRTYATLDVFHKEIGGTKPRNGTWGLNVPHWPLESNGANGVAGPGLPKGELFVPGRIRRRLEGIAGSYDKWRPYPAEDPLSSYAVRVARKFAQKRSKMLITISEDYPWDLIFYVEHAPASIAHLSSKRAMEVAEIPIRHAISVSKSWPNAMVVIFSPYGVGKKPGFVVSNALEGKDISTWEAVRMFLSGRAT
jgi:hypothetical protein